MREVCLEQVIHSPLSDFYWANRLGIPKGNVRFLRANGFLPDGEVLNRQPDERIRIEPAFETWDAAINQAKTHKYSWATKFYNRVKREALRRDISFALTFEECLELLKRSQGRCMLTGIPFSNRKLSKSHAACFKPSIDRINSLEGYFLANTRIVCVAANMATNQWGDSVLKVVALGFLMQCNEIPKTHQLDSLCQALLNEN